REVGVGETVEVEARVLDLDAKRLHLFQALRRAGEADPAAIAETAWLNVDMATRRGAPFRPEIHAQLEAQRALRAAEPWPERAGRSKPGGWLPSTRIARGRTGKRATARRIASSVARRMLSRSISSTDAAPTATMARLASAAASASRRAGERSLESVMPSTGS